MHDTTILWSWLSFVTTATIRGSIRPALMSATPVESSTTFLFRSSATASAFGLPPLPSRPNCDGSTGSEDACGCGAAGSAAGARLAGASESERPASSGAAGGADDFAGVPPVGDDLPPPAGAPAFAGSAAASSGDAGDACAFSDDAGGASGDADGSSGTAGSAGGDATSAAPLPPAGAASSPPAAGPAI